MTPHSRGSRAATAGPKGVRRLRGVKRWESGRAHLCCKEEELTAEGCATARGREGVLVEQAGDLVWRGGGQTGEWPWGLGEGAGRRAGLGWVECGEEES